ncbi:MAG TPA: hypothetical protein VN726_09525 [Hanamia sp.]|nr:hypothetical protein [Hanamia sp.]
MKQYISTRLANQNMNDTRILKITGVILAAFGFISLFLTGSILLDLFHMRAKEGNYIPFIVNTNFICSLIYLFAAYGFFVKNKFAPTSLFIAAIILVIAYVGLIIHINSGGKYETRTVTAMLFRIAITLLYAGIAWYYITRTKLLNKPD